MYCNPIMEYMGRVICNMIIMVETAGGIGESH